MEIFRLFLVLVGVALLGLVYLMGRRKPKMEKNVHQRATPKFYDPSVDELRTPIADPILADRSNLSEHTAPELDSNRATYTSADSAPVAEFDTSDNYDAVSHEVITESYSDQGATTQDERVTSFASAVKLAQAGDTVVQDIATDDLADFDADSSFSTTEFETYNEPVQLEEFEEKLVTVHVAAFPDSRFYGNDLKNLFDQHGYQFGHMSLYHCFLDQDKVFSIANMVKPGHFDEQEMAKFETPGITLFMRLPIELDSDVAFDFFIREARELADELGGQLRDENRNPLNEQTIQHMREDIQQYVFRTRRALPVS